MTIMSHLSDAQEAHNLLLTDCNAHINFVKYLVLRYKDLNQEHDPERDWREFCERHPTLAAPLA